MTNFVKISDDLFINGDMIAFVEIGKTINQGGDYPFREVRFFNNEGKKIKQAYVMLEDLERVLDKF